MGIIIWIVFGALVGWIASLLMKSSGGLFTNIMVGIVGALVGGFVMRFFGQDGVGGFNLYSFVVAILGACISIALVRMMRR